MTELRRAYVLPIVAIALLAAPDVRGQSLPDARVTGDGAVVRVILEAGRPVIERVRGGTREWARPLPAGSRFLQVGRSGSAVAGSIRFDSQTPRWAEVFDSNGENWRVPGTPRRVELSADGRRVLVQTSDEGKVATLVYDIAGRQFADMPIAFDDDLSVELSRAGDAVLVAPGGESSMAQVTLHDLESGAVRTVDLPGEEEAEQAIAIDANRLVTLGGGTLRFHDLSRDLAGWGRRSSTGYSTLLGVSNDGARILVSLRGGAYDLLDERGELIWSFRPAQPGRSLRSALAAVGDLRQIQVELLAHGDLLLLDRVTGSRYLLDEPGSARSEVRPVPAGALVGPDGLVVAAD